MAAIQLDFRSKLKSTSAHTWRWITSAVGIQREMRPLFRMTMPRDVASLDDLDPRPGHRLFRSRLFLLGFIPFGISDVTMLEWTAQVGFVEQSPMTGMKLWRHERSIVTDERGCTLTDQLTFEPRFAAPIVA